MNTEDREDKRKGFRGWLIMLGIVALLIGLIVSWVMVRRNSVERQLEALRAQGHPTSFAELAELHPLPDGAENAADTYVEAFGMFHPPTDNAHTLFVGEADWPANGEPLPEAVASATEQFLIDNRACLELLRQAGTVEHCRYDWDYGQSMPHLTSIKYCAQLLGSAVVLQACEGDTAAVLAYLTDGLHLARSLRNEPGLICYIVRVACTAWSFIALERAFSVTSFSDDQLVEMDRMLAETAATLDLRQALVSHRCFMIEDVENRSLLGGGKTRAWSIQGLVKFDQADILDYMAGCIEACELPAAEQMARFREISDEVDDLSFLHRVVKMLAPAPRRVAELDVRCKAAIDLVCTALAIERRRLATGTIPDDLASLVPDYLARVPIDPYDGCPIRFRRTDPGYRLYNVFEDGQDNGGLRKEQVKRGDPYDWPFVVTR